MTPTASSSLEKKAEPAATAPTSGSDGPLATLPPLQPINAAPFPDGATHEQTCAAIKDRDQKDVWLRFGHMLPMYTTGSLFVVQGGEPEMAKIEQFVRHEYAPNLYRADMRQCEGKILLWLGDMLDEDRQDLRGLTHGGRHFAESMRRHLGLTVIEEIYVHQSREHTRLSDYCKESATACDQLVRLDRTNNGEGLCSWAIYAADRLLPELPYKDKLSACRKLPPEALACACFADPDPNRQYTEFLECARRIAKALQLQRPANAP